MSGHTYTQDNYSNPCCACTLRVNYRLCLLVPQPDAICRAIGPAITSFSSMRSVIVPLFFKSRYVPRNLCTENAVPEEATRHEKVPGQESNGVCSL